MDKITSKTDTPLVAAIVGWTKQHVDNALLTEIEPDFVKNLTKTTKASLAGYLRTLTEHCERQTRLLAEQSKSLNSLNATVKKQKKQIDALKASLETQTRTLEDLTTQIQDKAKALADSNSHLADERKKVTELNQEIKTAKEKAQQLQEELLGKTTLLEKMSLKSMESFMSILPDWVAGETDWKTEYAKLQSETVKLTDKFGAIQNKFNALLNKHDREKNRYNENRSLLEDKIQLLIDENDLLLAKAANKNAKVSEQLGDYEKRENYQIVKEYRAFCLHQGLDYLAEEIVSAQQAGKKNYDDAQNRAQRAQMKSLLAENLLIKPYRMQVQRLRTKQTLIDYDTFQQDHVIGLSTQLELSGEIAVQLLQIGRKAFTLINELICVTPPCQLLIPENGAAFKPEQHDIDDLYCNAEGIIRLTIAPGVYSGHEVLMKPVVVTQLS